MELYKPFKSTVKGKKYSVYVLDKNKKKKKINFGDSNYRHNYSKKARDAYDKRSKGIRDKENRLSYKNKNSANYWSRTFLWKL